MTKSIFTLLQTAKFLKNVSEGKITEKQVNP